MKSTANGEKIIDYSVLDEGHSGNASCALILISTLLFHTSVSE